MHAACRSSVFKSLHPRLYHHSIPLCVPHLQPHFSESKPLHEHDPLGLRSHRPPDSSSGSEPPRREQQQLSDQDWELRTGRAIYVLQQTLPEFFEVGLVTSMDRATGMPSSSSISSNSGLRGIPLLNANPLDMQVGVGVDDSEDVDVQGIGIYSPKVGLCYTPPVALPPPFPATLHLEGLPLYLASAVFVRHTLNALYVDLRVELRKFVVKTPTARNATQAAWSSQGSKNRIGREKSLVVGFCVTGTSRVSGAQGEWEIASTYKFSPSTGLISRHVIDSIYPAPHHAVYDSLRMSLGKVFGFGEGRVQGGNGGAACRPTDP